MTTDADRVYRRLSEAWGDEALDRFRDTVVLDEEARTLYSSSAVLDRVVAGRSGSGGAVPAWNSLFTWAAEAVEEGEADEGLTAAAERASAARSRVESSDGVDALLREYAAADELGWTTEFERLSGLFPAVVALLTEAGRGGETARVLEHLERFDDLTTLGLCLVRAGASDPDAVVVHTVTRYVEAVAGKLRSALGRIHRDGVLRRQLLTLAQVCLMYSCAKDDHEELLALRAAFDREPREFPALFWGNEATGVLVAFALHLSDETARLWQEACRERWFFDWMVRLAEPAESAGEIFSELLVTSALRSERVAAWLAGEPATRARPLAGAGWRLRLLLLRARVPRRSLYAQCLARTLRSGRVFDFAETGALRRLADASGPLEPRLWPLVGVLFGLATGVGSLVDQGLSWWYLVLVVALGLPTALLAARLITLEWLTAQWTRSALLPLRDPGRASLDLYGAVRGWSLLDSASWALSWLHGTSTLREKRLVPLWGVVAYRDEIQVNPVLSAQLSEELGGRTIHTADDVSVLLARSLPHEPV